jgi:phage-related protein
MTWFSESRECTPNVRGDFLPSDRCSAAAQPIIDRILPIMVSLFEDLMPVLWDLIENAILPLVDAAFQIIEAFLPLIEMILPMLVDLIEFLTPILVFIGELLGVVLVAAVGFFVAAFEKVQTFFEKFGPIFKNIFINSFLFIHNSTRHNVS